MTGKKYLILGNHDRHEDIPTEMFEDVVDLAKVSIKIKDHEWKTFILSHRPILCWEGSNDGTIMLHGHIHSSPNLELTSDTEIYQILESKNCFDVGVDNNDYKPVSVNEVLFKIDNKICNFNQKLSSLPK